MEYLTCPECGNPVDPSRRICPIDGYRFDDAPTSPEAPDRANLTTVDPPEPSAAASSLGNDPFAEDSGAVQVHISSARGQRSVQLGLGDLLEIGREVGSLGDLCTDNISAAHAELAVRPDRTEIRDTGRALRGSTNGTFLDGVRLPPNRWTTVPDGAVIRLGSDPALTIRVSVTP